MENILKKNFKRAEQLLTAYVVVIVMAFGIFNPLAYVTERNTAREISGMGKVVFLDTTALPSGNLSSEQLRQRIRKLTLKKEILGDLSRKRDFSELYKARNIAVNALPSAENSAFPMSTDDGQENYKDLSPAIMNSDATAIIPDRNKTVEEIPGVTTEPIAEPITDNENTSDESAYIEISGMKIDSDGYVTEIMSDVLDGVIAFPTDIRCKGIRSDIFEKSDGSLKTEIEEVYIPANIVDFDDGLFDCLKNVDFIQVAKGNPAYYSEAGILYHTDGSLACMPQARIYN